MAASGQLNPQGQDLALNRLMQLQANQQANAPQNCASVSDQIAIRKEQRDQIKFDQEQEALRKPKAPHNPFIWKRY